MTVSVQVLVAIAIFTTYCGVVLGSPAEFRLLTSLLQGYDKSIRPVRNVTDAINLSFDVNLNQVIGVEERRQIIKLNVWMRWYWTDYNLRWNASDHNGIEEIYIQPSRIWIPDLTLYNSVSEIDHGWPIQYNVKIKSDGSTTYLFPVFLEASCKIDVTYFPFDTQRCSLKFGSWGYSAVALDVYQVNDHGDTSAFVGNGVWELIGFPARREVNYYSCCADPYPDVTFTVTLKRLPLYYFFNLLLPCILITILNLFTFLLPVESGEKISLNITVLLTMMVFLLIVAEIMPPQSEVVPIIGGYFGACIFLLSFATLITVFVIHLNFRGNRGRPVPSYLKKYLFNWLGILLLYGDTLRTSRFNDVTKTTKEKPYTISAKIGDAEKNQYVQEAETSSVSDISVQCRAEQEWKTVALIVDRLFFVLFSLGTVAITVYSLYYM